MEVKIDEILSQLNKLDCIIKEVMDTKSTTKTEIQNINDTISNNTKKKSSLEVKIKTQQDTINKLEKTIKKRNLVTVGIPEKDNNKKNLEEVVIELALKHLKIVISSADIEDIFRLGKKGSHCRPILVSFVSLKTKLAL